MSASLSGAVHCTAKKCVPAVWLLIVVFSIGREGEKMEEKETGWLKWSRTNIRMLDNKADMLYCKFSADKPSFACCTTYSPTAAVRRRRKSYENPGSERSKHFAAPHPDHRSFCCWSTGTLALTDCKTKLSGRADHEKFTTTTSTDLIKCHVL